jgi:hypothetical protein
VLALEAPQLIHREGKQGHRRQCAPLGADETLVEHYSRSGVPSTRITRLDPMARDGMTTFSDIAGKLEMLRVECEKCGRKGQYRVMG